MVKNGKIVQRKKMSPEQEFEVMKLVLDKFLWLGTAIMVYGLYQILVGNPESGIWALIIGVIVLFLFLRVILKYEFDSKLR